MSHFLWVVQATLKQSTLSLNQSEEGLNSLMPPSRTPSGEKLNTGASLSPMSHFSFEFTRNSFSKLSKIRSNLSSNFDFSALQARTGSLATRIRMDKSTIILITIVVLFFITHCCRLALKLYDVFLPGSQTYENFDHCLGLGR